LPSLHVQIAASHRDFDAVASKILSGGQRHKSLTALSPAMAAGVSDKLWSMTALSEMIDASLPKPGKRGPYKRHSQWRGGG